MELLQDCVRLLRKAKLQNALDHSAPIGVRRQGIDL